MREMLYARMPPMSFYQSAMMTPDMKFPVEIKKVPYCKCHNIQMNWHTDRSKKNGGCFRCLIKRRESNRRSGARKRNTDQVYRTKELIRRRRKHRQDAIERYDKELELFNPRKEKYSEKAD